MQATLVQIDRPQDWLDWCRSSEFRPTLQRGCRVRVEHPGTAARTARISLPAAKVAQFGLFIEELRRNPAHSLTADSEAALRLLVADWFREKGLSNGGNGELHLCGTADSEPWFSGIPWELAGHDPGATIADRLAGQAFARRLTATQAYRPSAGRLLRVLTCIAFQPDEQAGIDPGLFREELRTVLGDRDDMIDWRDATQPGFAPRYARLEAMMTEHCPHVVILACHGRLNNVEPELRFEHWVRVADFAGALAAEQHAMTVVLLACNQAMLARTRAQRSGAIVLLTAGVPSVIAMQNSIRADCAAWFLGGLLDGMVEDGRMAHAAKIGRRQIASHLAADDLRRVLDWSFPALFINDQGAEGLDQLAEMPRELRRQLGATMRGIPRPAFDIARTADAWDWDGATGLAGRRGWFQVWGAPGSGKTQWVRKLSRHHISRQIEGGTPDKRKVLYVDFDRATDVASDCLGLYEVVRKQARQCSPADAVWDPWYWPALSGDDPLSHFAEILDANRIVLVLDHYERIVESLPEGLEERLAGLHQSLVVLIADHPPINPDSGYEITALTLEDIRAYFAGRGGPAVTPEDILLHTGGVMRTVERYWYSLQRGDDMNGSDALYLAWVLDGLTPEQRRLLFLLSRLSEGVNLALLHARLGRPDDFRQLDRKGVCLREYRAGVSSPFVRLAGALAEALEEAHPDEAEDADRHLLDRVLASLEQWPGSPVERLEALAHASGGLDLLLAVQQACGRLGEFDRIVALAESLDRPLTSRGNWQAAFRLWGNAAVVADERPLSADQWVSFGWSRLYTGDATGAGDCVTKARALTNLALSPSRLRLLEAAWLKATGQREREPQILEIYESIVQAGDQTAPARKNAALARYNRALIHRHWRNDLPAALADLATARLIFEEQGDRPMVAITHCEEVEVRLRAPGSGAEFAELLRAILDAEKQLAATDDYAGQAFAAYQRARLYRQQAGALDGVERINLLSRAQAAYGDARDLADRRELVVERCAGEIHFIELGCGALANVAPREADERLERAVVLLRLARGDAWAQRLQRDTRILQARIASTPDSGIECWQEALTCAVTFPCHPSYGTDRIRTADILRQLAEALRASDRAAELDQTLIQHQALIEQMIGRPFTFDGTNHAEWIAALPQ
ncbi:MAG: CHAT domain-containing protein [Verrucomicrobiota bacterium]